MKEIKESVVYSKLSLHDFREYGIEIPLLGNRVLETAEYFDISSTSFPMITMDDLELAHDQEFIQRMKSDPERLVEETYELLKSDGQFHRYNPDKAIKPLSDFIEKAMSNVSGTYFASRKALEKKFCYHLGGGMHHAMSFRPGGFCMFNDLIVSARKLQKEEAVGKIGIIDLDCHKGDGTAEITRNDDSIATFSIHMAKGWPLDGNPSGPSFIPSTIDVPVNLEDDYLLLLKNGINRFLEDEFDICFVVHGVDVWEHDALESSKQIMLTKDQILERDLFVYQSLKERKIPQAWCLGGGYGPGVSQLYIQFLKTVFNE